MSNDKKATKLEHPIAGNRRKTVSSGVATNLPEGVAGALEKVKELNEAELNLPEEEGEVDFQLSDLRELLFLGKIREKVTIGGYVFELSTLSNRQQNSLVSRLVKLDGEERLLQIKPFTLYESLISINGVKVEELFGEDDELSDSDKKLEVIANMQSTLVDRLFNEYEKINKKSTDLTKSNELGEKVKK